MSEFSCNLEKRQLRFTYNLKEQQKMIPLKEFILLGFVSDFILHILGKKFHKVYCRSHQYLT